MAKTVTAIPGRKDGRQMYPWHKWLNGKIWELRQGKDFKGKPSMMAQQAYVKGRNQKVTVKTAVRGTRVYLHAQPIVAPSKGKRG
jgi:hypothetical protein